MATVTKPIALDESFNTTEVTPRNIADVLAEGLSHITGRTASEVEYDNTDSGLTADNVQDAIDEVNGKVPTLPSVDIQTAVDEFETYNGGLLSECKVALSPNQDLHGYDHPWVGGASKNKCAMTLAKIKALNTSGTWSGNVYTNLGVTYTILTDDADNIIGFDTNGTATARGWMFISDADYGETTVYFNGTTINGYTFTSSNPSAVDSVRCVAYNYFTKMSYILIDNGITTNHEKWYPMIRLSTESDPTFAPYTNICPITGHTEAKAGDDGKNKCPDIERGTYDTASGAKVTDNRRLRTEKKFFIKAGTYYISFSTSAVGKTLRFWYMLWASDAESGNPQTYNSGWINTEGVITITTDTYMSVQFGYTDDDYITASDVKAQLELGSTATSYVPYNGYQVTVNLGGTYYSGTLDVVSGVFVPDTASVDMGDLNWIKDGILYRAEIPTTKRYPTNVAAPWSCECYKILVQGNVGSDIGISSLNWTESAALWNTSFANATEVKNALSGQHLVYELATPQSIQLSPTMVKALVGENHLSAPLEGQEITESKYKQTFTFDDVIAYIQSIS